MISSTSLEDAFQSFLGSDTRVSFWLSELVVRLSATKEEVVDALDKYHSLPETQRPYVVRKSGFKARDDYQLEVEKQK